MAASPDGRAAVLIEMAYAAHRRQEVDDGGLVDMLEIVESARLWALDESDRGWEWVGRTPEEGGYDCLKPKHRGSTG